MENVTTTNQMPTSHASDTLPNTAGLSVTNGVPNTSNTSNMPGGSTGSANVQVTDQTASGKTDGQTDAAVQSNVDTAKDAKLDSEGGNKEQLRRRVMQRESDLSKALEGLEGNEERRSALQGALDAGRDYLKTGWEHIGEVEAAQLSRWLETSDTLVAQGIPADAASETVKVDSADQPVNTAADQPAVKA